MKKINHKIYKKKKNTNPKAPLVKVQGSMTNVERRVSYLISLWIFESSLSLMIKIAYNVYMKLIYRFLFLLFFKVIIGAKLTCWFQNETGNNKNKITTHFRIHLISSLAFHFAQNISQFISSHFLLSILPKTYAI